MNIIPAKGYITAKKAVEESTTTSGFYIPKETNDNIVVVVASSTDLVSTGDKIVYDRASAEVADLLIIHETSILGVVTA